MKTIDISLPLTIDSRLGIKAGQMVRLSGTIYTMRDQAHKRVCELLEGGMIPPISLENAVIYYAGPTPIMPDGRVGAIGPTTSSRMDVYTESMLKAGVTGLIGKGARSKSTVDAIQQHKCIYFVAVGGAGAFYAEKVQQIKLVAYPDLGPEAIYRLEVSLFPVFVAIDAYGNNLFDRN